MLTIIAILAAILFPVFQKVGENARRASCQSNLKQLGLAFVQYTQDADEKFPTPTAGNRADKLSFGHGWGYAIYPFVKSTGVYACPDDSSTDGSEVFLRDEFSALRHVSFAAQCTCFYRKPV